MSQVNRDAINSFTITSAPLVLDIASTQANNIRDNMKIIR